MIRDLELILLPSGGAELIDLEDEKQVWASDSDDDFRGAFPDLLAEDDVEDVLNYLVSQGVMSDDEADVAEVSLEDAQGKERPGGPGDDEDDDDDGDEDVETHLGEFVG